MLNNAPFTLSEVGLVEFPLGVLSLCPFAMPDMTLKITIPPIFYKLHYALTYAILHYSK